MIVVEEFFREATDMGASYDPNKIYPQGRIFGFSFWALPINSVPLAKISGITVVGPYYNSYVDDDSANDSAVISTQNDIILAARANGLKCICKIGIKMNFLDHVPRSLTDAQIMQHITAQVSKLQPNPEVCGWNLDPEEMRYWYPNEIHYMHVAYNAIKAADSQNRPVFMYEPGNRPATDLVHTVVYQDMLGMGIFTNYSFLKTQRVYAKWCLKQEKQAIASAHSSTVPMAIPEMFEEKCGILDRDEYPMIPKWVRHDVYLSLISGAKFVTVFSGAKRNGGFLSYDHYYDAYRAVANEISGPLNLGYVFLFGEKRTDITVTVTSGPSITVLNGSINYPFSCSSNGSAVTYPSVNFLNVAYGRKRYLFLVNSANSEVTITVGGFPTETILREDIFAGTVSGQAGGSFSLTLADLEAKAFCFSPKARF